jgi:serine/threonine-protein kinase
LGEGGVARVWLAWDEHLRREVAIKVLRPQYARDENLVQRFRREALLVGQLRSPHIVEVFGVAAGGSASYFVMEYVDGRDLKEFLRYNAPLPVERALSLLRDITAGVAAAHEAGLIHRDLKPANVLISKDGAVKVTDFGIARDLAGAGLTEPGKVWGTSHYLSPEQAAGLGLAPATDIYSLGVMLFEMVTGRLPFPGDDPVAVALAHLRDPVPDVQSLNTTVPEGVARLIRRMMDKAPERRPRDAPALLKLLETYLSQSGGATTLRPVMNEITLAPASPPTRARSRAMRHPTPAAETSSSSTRARRWGAQIAIVALGVLVILLTFTLARGSTILPEGRQRTPSNQRNLPAASPSLPVPTFTASAASMAGTPGAPSLRASPTRTRTTPTVSPTATMTALLVRSGNGPDARVQHLTAPSSITVDGNLSEWVSQPVPLTQPIYGIERWGGPSDLSGRVYFAWDEDFLYLAVYRVDDEHLQSETHRGYDLYRGDAVELWLDTELARDFEEAEANRTVQDDYQLAFSAGNFSTLRPEGVVYFPRRNAEWDHQIRVRAEPLGNGYTLEASVPWSLLRVEPEENLVLGYAVVFNDNDSPPGEEPQSQVASNRESPYRRPSTFGNLVLAP